MNSYSYSAFADFAKCQRQFYYVRLTRKVKRKYDSGGPGRAFHAAIDRAIKHNEDTLPSRFKEYNWTLQRLAKIKQKMEQDRPDGITYAHTELGMSVYPDWTLGPMYAKGAFYCGAIDLVLERGDLAFITDWKFGNSAYADLDQLYQQAMLLFLAKPNIMTIRADLTFVKDKLRVPLLPLTIERSTFQDIQGDVLRLANRIASKDPLLPEDWVPTQSGLCGYCPLTKEYCPHSDKDPAMPAPVVQ